MKALLRLTALILVIAVAAGAWIAYRVNQPYKGFRDPVFVEFGRGTSSRSIAATLAARGVIQQGWLFLAARGLRRNVNLQAGEYKFDKPASPLEIISRLARGDIYYMELLVPEGFNMYEAADAVAKLGTMRAETFLAAAKDPAMIRDLDPDAPSLEGYLFPNKYRVYRHTTAQQICRMMTGEFRERWKTLHALNSEAKVHDVVTLASMVEREAKLPAERPMVASVFQNRLRIGMKLDCDPTTVYAALLENRYRGTIYRSDLGNPSPWNTYRHKGLPPGPIANPGLSSLQAALSPADTSFLYFVAKADGTGGHNFSNSLGEHTVNVAKYQRAQSH